MPWAVGHLFLKIGFKGRSQCRPIFMPLSAKTIKRLMNGLHLSPRQVAFVKAYTSETVFNATAAARLVWGPGKPENHYRVLGYQYAKDPAVREAIAIVMQDRGVSADRVVEEIRSLAIEADIAQFSGLLDGSETLQSLKEKGVDTKLLKSVTHTDLGQGRSRVKIELWDRQRALEQLANVTHVVEAPKPSLVSVLAIGNEAVAGLLESIQARRPVLPAGQSEEVIDVEAETVKDTSP